MAKHTLNIIDDDDAASKGTAVYVVPGTYHEVMAHLESTTANDASIAVTTEEGTDGVLVTDSDSPGGVQIYVDEDASAGPDARLLCVSPHNMDLFVPLRSGRLLRIADDDDAATNGVALYVDDDGATTDERFLFVSPTNADATVKTRGQLQSILAD